MAGPPRIDGPVGPVGFEREFVGPSSTATPAVLPGVSPVYPANGAPDLLAQANSRVIMQYKGSTKLLAMIAAVIYPLQNIANTLKSMEVLDDPNQAPGVNLDVIGEIVGQTRILPGFLRVTDDQLRLLIALRIIRNRSGARGPEIIEAMRALLNDSTKITYTSPGQMYIDLQIARQPSSFERAAINDDLIPRPVGVDMVPSWYVASQFVGWDDDPDPGAVGMGEDGDDSIGGWLAEFI